MSYLAIEQLENDVAIAQKIKMPKSSNLEVLRLYMYKQGTLIDGIINVEVYDGTNLLGTMSENCIELNNIGPNFHGKISFYPNSPISIRKNPRDVSVEITFKVKVTSHTNNDSAFVGLVREPNPVVGLYNQSNNPNSPDPTVDVYYLPFGLELYTT